MTMTKAAKSNNSDSAKQAPSPAKRIPGGLGRSSEFHGSINDAVLDLHRTVGNREVARLFRSGEIQAKFNIGTPGDIYEQEADRLADRVMRMPVPDVQAKPT